MKARLNGEWFSYDRLRKSRCVPTITTSTTLR